MLIMKLTLTSGHHHRNGPSSRIVVNSLALVPTTLSIVSKDLFSRVGYHYSSLKTSP
jgi:hypothetical protein